MPIYEFKCLQCNECVEILVMSGKKPVDMRCPACGAENLERILSCSSYAMHDGTHAGRGVKAQTRSCSGGSCTTIEISGPPR